MKIHLLLSLIAFLMLTFACTQVADEQSVSEQQPEIAYDSLKVAEYGADDYGMKKYVMAFLRRGSNQDLDSAQSAQLQRAHMDNIILLAEEGVLVLAGPFYGKGDLRGIYVFDVQSIEEAEALTNTDPAIQQGALEMELLEWYGSAALMELSELHKVLAKKSI